MKYLNLTKGFNPFKSNKVDTFEFESFIFNGGEPHIKLKDLHSSFYPLTITCRIKSFNDLGLLLVAVDAIKRVGFTNEIHLFMPYAPGARQDRVMVNGESLTSKVYADIINSLNLASVSIFDPHSDVISALIDNCKVIDNHEFVENCLDFSEPCEFNIVSPDAGANKKVTSLCKYLSHYHKEDIFNIIKCDKTRDVSTGKLTGFEVYPNSGLDGIAPVYIVDDICDGGGTFIGLAKELKKKGAGDLYLIVSHGIFSKGFKELRKYFKGIYTTDSWRSNISMETPEIEKGSEIVNIIKFEDEYDI